MCGVASPLSACVHVRGRRGAPVDNLPDVPFPWVETTPFCGSARHTWGGFSPSFWFDRKFGDRVETGPESAAVKAEGVAGLVTLAASAPACLPPSAAANAAGSCDHVARWGLCCPQGGVLREQTPGLATCLWSRGQLPVPSVEQPWPRASGGQTGKVPGAGTRLSPLACGGKCLGAPRRLPLELLAASELCSQRQSRGGRGGD